MAYFHGSPGGKRSRGYPPPKSFEQGYYETDPDNAGMDTRGMNRYAPARRRGPGRDRNPTHASTGAPGASRYAVDGIQDAAPLQYGVLRASGPLRVGGIGRRGTVTGPSSRHYQNRGDTTSMDTSNDFHQSISTATNALRGEPLNCCRYWMTNGYCRQLQHCRYRHDLRLVGRVADAHTRGIYSICSVTVMPEESDRQMLDLEPGVSVVELYTASQDKTVKRWMLYPATATPSGHPGPGLDQGSKLSLRNAAGSRQPKLKLRLASTIELESACLSVFFGSGCLVCGLSNGAVKVYEREHGREMTLTGHTSEVHCVKLIDHVLITGDWSGSLRLWTPDAMQKSFVQTASIEIGSPITCFIDVTIPVPPPGFPMATDALPAQRYLWVGCSGSIKIVDLQTLALVRSISFPSAIRTVPGGLKKGRHLQGTSRPVAVVVMGLLAVDQHVVCSLLNGTVKVFSALDGSEVSVGASQTDTLDPQQPAGTARHPPTHSSTRHEEKNTFRRHLCAMAGSSSDQGPVLVCGRSQGFISVLSLPELRERAVFKHGHEQDVRAVHNIGGDPSYFSTGGFDGTLCIWHWEKPADYYPPSSP